MIKKYIVHRNFSVEVFNINLLKVNNLETIINFKTDMEIINYLKSFLEVLIGYGQNISAIEGIVINNRELKQVNIQVIRNGRKEIDVLRMKQYKEITQRELVI